MVVICLAALTALADMPGVSKLAGADNGFAFDLLRQVANGQPGQNIFLSPYSAAVALQMLDNGAKGKTRDEIQSVLKTEDMPPGEANGACGDLRQSLLSQTNVILDLANSIWVNKGFELKADFVAANQEFFQAQLESVNFQTPESADIINQWAAINTQGKINNVVAFPFPIHTELVLADAIYFKGKWQTPFDKSRTRRLYFYLAGGVIKQTPMMSQHGKFRYQQAKNFQAIQLPYAGNRLQMMLFLPATNSSPAKLLAQINGTNWESKILPGFLERDGTVTFPKFKLNYEIELNLPLQALGMKQAFIPGAANFSAMSADALYVSLVKQKSYVDVNEEGTEAAAVTTVTMTALAIMRPLAPFEMLVNRPFLFLIADSATHVILFAGIVNDPTVH